MDIFEVFENKDLGRIRVVMVDDIPWFVAKDIAQVLDYSNLRMAIKRNVDEEDCMKGVTICDAKGMKRDHVCVNESGLYSLLLSCTKPAAKKMKRWITSEVIPSLWRSGGYVVNDDLFLDTYFPGADEATRGFMRMQLEYIRSLNEKVEKNETNSPKENKETLAKFSEPSGDSILVRELAETLRQNGIMIGQKRLFSWLRNNKFLARDSRNANVPTQKSLDQGLFELKSRPYTCFNGFTTSTVTPLVTKKGQAYFLNRFLSGEF